LAENLSSLKVDMKIVKENEHCLSLNVGVLARGGRCLSIMRGLQSIRPLNLRLKLAAIAAVSQSSSRNKYADVVPKIF
jgi:hypothetical protein